jgi:hypothetical protein
MKFHFLKKTLGISILFLFAIALVMAHSIIPHHHFDESCALSINGNCHAASCQASESTKVPWHCQAYNHVIFYDPQVVNNRNLPATTPFEFNSDRIADLVVWFEPEYTCHPLTGSALWKNSFLPLLSLRGPPTVSC